MLRVALSAVVLGVSSLICLPVVAQELNVQPIDQNVMATDGSEIMTTMQQEGFLVTRETADDGTPKLVSRVSDTEFRVYFYGCETPPNPCTSIQFSAGYDLESPMSMNQINQWNSENRFSRALLDDEGDPFLRLDVAFFGDGVGRENFVEILDLWRELVEDFETHIDW